VEELRLCILVVAVTWLAYAIVAADDDVYNEGVTRALVRSYSHHGRSGSGSVAPNAICVIVNWAGEGAIRVLVVMNLAVSDLSQIAKDSSNSKILRKSTIKN
jgi:hypothetical protein